MYATIRQYTGVDDRAFAALMSRRDDVEALIRQTTGLAHYHLIRTRTGVMSVTVCDTRAGAEDSNRRVANWVKANMPALLPTPPRIVAGEDVLHVTTA